MQTPFRFTLLLLYAALAILIISLFIYFMDSPGKMSEDKGPHEKEATLDVKQLSPKAAEGLKLFKDVGCVSCHNLCSKKIGPPLKGISKKRKREWIHKFVLNSQLLIEQKDPEAVAIYNEFGKTPMPAHTFLKPEEIDKIIFYLNTAECDQQ